MKILVGYYSKSGHTKRMAESIVEGIKKENVTAEIKKVEDINVDELLEFDAIILGSPTYYGIMAADLKKLLDESVKHHGKLSGKIGGAFSTSGMMGGGGETTILSILQTLLVHGMIVVGDARMQHYGPLAIGEPDGNALDICQKYGQKIAKLTVKLFG